MPKIVYIGRTFGSLKVLKQWTKNRRSYCEAECKCGAVVTARLDHVRSLHTKWCNDCMRKAVGDKQRTHSEAGSPVYMTWAHIKSRCCNPNNTHYSYYGGRGITVCERWINSYENFRDDMGPKPTPKHTIDRIDVNGNYEPGNCRWATRKEQQSNRRVNNLISFGGETLTITQWADRIGARCSVIRGRIKAGWSLERALTEPVHP